MKISHITATTILDSRGRPTVSITIAAEELEASASVPSGKSTGSREAKELRDEDGGVATVCANIQGEIATALATRDFESPQELDAFLCDLDGTSDKSRLGANAILPISIAATRIFAQEKGVPLWHYLAQAYNMTPGAPRLYVNMINGGAHAKFRLPFQEHILVVGEDTLTQSLETAAAAFAALGDTLREGEPDLPMGDEGGYSPTFDSIERPLEVLSDIIATNSHTMLAIDAAANELLSDGAYVLLGKSYSADELQELYVGLAAKFPFHTIEDPFAETDPEHFASLTKLLGEKIIILGDDLIVTNPDRIEWAIAGKLINGALIKPNQIGTVSEAVEAVRSARAANWKTVASHRSGETDDTFIADFAYAMGMHGIKAGGLGQKIRLEKYERLSTIEHEARELDT